MLVFRKLGQHEMAFVISFAKSYISLRMKLNINSIKSMIWLDVIHLELIGMWKKGVLYQNGIQLIEE